MPKHGTGMEIHISDRGPRLDISISHLVNPACDLTTVFFFHQDNPVALSVIGVQQGLEAFWHAEPINYGQ